nr:AbfB domain-containing protein [Cystobacter ferrugineus]
MPSTSSSTLKQDATFKIVAGLADAACYSWVLMTGE